MRIKKIQIIRSFIKWVLYFRPSTDEFFVRATVDIETEGRESKETLENQLRYFISNSRAFNPSSPLTVVDKGFDIMQGKFERETVTQTNGTDIYLFAKGHLCRYIARNLLCLGIILRVYYIV